MSIESAAVNSKSVELYLLFARTIAEGVKAAGADGIPSGYLYSMLIGKISLEAYERLISQLVRSGVIDKRGDLLVWALDSSKSPSS